MAGREREQAETQARIAAQSGDAYDELIAEGQQYISKDDWRRAARAAREAIALSPDMPNRVLQPRCSAQQLGVLRGGGAAVPWGQGALSGELAGLGTGHCSGLQLADARGVRRGGQAGRGGTTRGSRRCRRGYLVREAPDDGVAHQMRANVLCGQCNGAWETGPRSAAELKEAATADALRAGCGAAPCSASGGESPVRRPRGLVPPPGGEAM